MSETDREKWNARYASGAYAARPWPTPLLTDWIERLPRNRALDVACGAGRNSLYLAEHGFAVDGVDVSAVALDRARAAAAERGLEATFTETDLEAKLPTDRRYDLIVMVRYTHPVLVAELVELLNDGGCLFCEEHLRTSADVIGPTNPAYRMDPNELLRLAAGLRILYYREGIIDDPDGRPAALAQLIGCRGNAGF